MKKKWFILCIPFLFLGINSFLSAQENSMDNLLFSLSIKELNSLSPSEMDKISNERKWLLLDGSLAVLTRVSGKNDEYVLDAQLIQGEWKGLDEVLKYSCHLIFRGDNWKQIIPDKPPRKPVKGQILLNSRVLVLATLMGYDMVDGVAVPYLLVDKIRLLQ